MRIRRSAFVAVLLVIATTTRGAGAAPAPAGPLGKLPASYVELYRQILERGSQARHFTLAESAALSHVALRLWRQTHEAAFRQTAQKFFAQAISDPQFSLKDFHILHHFGELAWGMRQEKLLTPEQEEKLTSLAVAQLNAFCDSNDDGDYNIRIGQVAGYAGLEKFLDGKPFDRRADVDRRLNEYWSKIAATGDLDEDASNYDSLGLAFLIDLARLLGRENDIRQSANFRRQFERFRDIVSPAGLMPEYGDSYFGYTSCSLDRVYLLEYAAKLFDDLTFLYAARKLYGRQQAGLPAFDSWTRAFALIDLDVSHTEPRAPSGPPSMVTYRARRGTTKRLVDKLILRTGLDAGSAMVMLDLYASGSHAHLEKGPSIAYYENRQVPLFHNLGRHGVSSAIDGNLCWALPATKTFPGSWNQENKWFTMTIPVDDLARQDDRYVLAPALSLRNFQERNHDCSYVFFDNLRLEGPAGVRIVDNFDSTAGWDPRLLKRTEIINSDDKTEGKFSQRAAWKAVPSAEFRRNFPGGKEFSFTKEQYDSLKLDLKYVGHRPTMHIRGLGRQVDLGDQLLVSKLASARAEQRGRDAFGEVKYSTYITSDTSLTRRIVLTAEGYLIVHDVLTPGPSMDGWNAGSLWQLYAMQSQGPDWFCSEDDGAYPDASALSTVPAQRMLVRFATDGGAQTGVEAVDQEYYDPNPRGRRPNRFFTTFVERKVASGHPVAFTYAVLPHNPADGPPATIADRIAIEPAPDNTANVKISATAGGQNVDVRIRGDDWSVTRSAPSPQR